jgi:hypothetical protein
MKLFLVPETKTQHIVGPRREKEKANAGEGREGARKMYLKRERSEKLSNYYNDL